MPLLDRLKERFETDLSDTELQAILDEVAAEIAARFGPLGAIVVERDGGARVLGVWRPIDTGQALAVTEVTGPAESGGETVLAADDYRVRDGGRTLERLATGTNAASHWAPLVRLAYTPVDDAAQRDEVALQVAILEAQYRGLSGERAGDWQAGYPDAAAERERRLNTLAPRRGLGLA